MSKMHLSQPEFNDSACCLFTKNEERFQKFKETEDSRYIYQNRLLKACFQHDLAYEDFRDFPKRTAADKVLPDKHLILLKILDMMEIEEVYLQWFIWCKYCRWCCLKQNLKNKKLAKKSRTLVIRKFEKWKVHSSFIDSIWGVDVANIQLLGKFKKGIRFLWSFIDIYSKYVWVTPLEDKKGITITNTFEKILDESDSKSNKIWVDKDSEFYNRSMKSQIEKMVKEWTQHIIKENLLLLKNPIEP